MHFYSRPVTFLACLTLALAFPADGRAQKKKKGKNGEINTPAAKGERKSTTLRPGDPAVDFTLPDLKKSTEVKLSSFRGKKPVVLIFGSYT
ncbi:MAG: hypothetical protein HYX68_09085 [Planctomycetes bacterium]|nr:hypothetical protein [Planctomycetota bacterium]